MTTKQFDQSVTDSIKNLVNKAKVNPLTQNPDGSPKWQNPDTVMQRGDLYGIPYKAKVPDSFSDWLKSNSDSIEIPLDRTEATAQWFDDKAKNERPF